MLKKLILITPMLIICGSSLGVERMGKKAAKKMKDEADMELLDRTIETLNTEPAEYLTAAGAGQNPDILKRAALLKRLQAKKSSRNLPPLRSRAGIVNFHAGTTDIDLPPTLLNSGIKTKIKTIGGVNIKKSSILGICIACSELLAVRTPGSILCKHCSLAACSNKEHKKYAFEKHNREECRPLAASK